MAVYPKQSTEFGILQRLIFRYRNLLMSSPEFEIFMFICDRVYSFYKFGENIKPAHFHGMHSPKFSHPGLNKDPSRVRHLKIDLIKKKLVFRINPNFYIPNTFGLLKLFSTDLKQLMNDKEQDMCDTLMPLFSKEYPKITARIQPVEAEMTRIEDGVVTGKEKSRLSKLKKKKKLMAKPEQYYKPSDVARILKALIEEVYEGEVPYMEYWSKKLGGLARNWLNELKELDQSPKEILRQVVEKWSIMRASLKGEFGNSLNLLTMPSFEQFYRHKLKIYDYLHEHQHEEKSVEPEWEDI